MRIDDLFVKGLAFRDAMPLLADGNSEKEDRQWANSLFLAYRSAIFPSIYCRLDANLRTKAAAAMLERQRSRCLKVFRNAGLSESEIQEIEARDADKTRFISKMAEWARSTREQKALRESLASTPKKQEQEKIRSTPGARV